MPVGSGDLFAFLWILIMRIEIEYVASGRPL